MTPQVKILQIEVTTQCNFQCQMCFHSQEDIPKQHIPVPLFEKIAQSSFGQLDRLILYGIGEPLTHPHFTVLLDIARRYMKKEGKIEFTTNGSLLTPSLVDQIVSYRIDRIIISIDSPFTMKNHDIRFGFSDQILENLKYLSEVQHQGLIRQIALESVLSKQNLYDLPYLVQFCKNYRIQSLYISHLLPYTETMHDHTLFIPVSEDAFEVMIDVVKNGWEVINQIILTPKYTKIIETEKHPRIQHIFQQLKEAHQSDTDIDLRKLLEVYQLIPQINQVRHVFEEVSDLAKKYQIQVDLPPIFVNSQARSCPFVDRDALFITVEGEVVPCYNLAHSHTVHINHHLRQEDAVSFGNIQDQSLENILSTKYTQEFISRLKKFAQKTPWCGDCIYSTQNCYYVKNNQTDCFGNQPGCNECVYSTGFVKCLFD